MADTQVKDQPWGTYWDEEGKYQEQYTKAWEKLIPASGEAEDGLPEALRAISRIGYEYFNNGFCNLWRDWEDVDEDGHDTIERTMDSYYEDMVDYLRDYVPSGLYREFRGWLPTINYASIKWGEDGDDVVDRIINHIMEGIIKDGLLEEVCDECGYVDDEVASHYEECSKLDKELVD